MLLCKRDEFQFIRIYFAIFNAEIQTLTGDAIKILGKNNPEALDRKGNKFGVQAREEVVEVHLIQKVIGRLTFHKILGENLNVAQVPPDDPVEPFLGPNDVVLVLKQFCFVDEVE